MKLKTMVVAIAAFFGASMLALHLIYRSEPPPAASVPGEAPLVPAPPAPSPVERRDLPGAGSGQDETALAASALSVDQERALNDCIERNVHGRGYDDVKPVLPGRWPAVKRARERLRMRRLEMRAACLEELARALPR